ncbi:MAG: hypothetical protein DRP09_19895 [Candidatus Thorarchaeota archaeon]|nr:MAG: hypothetical protein DRP09_19895 [Candidatus Thorarchaeota archaeon]
MKKLALLLVIIAIGMLGLSYGCLEDSENNVISISELGKHADKYLNKEVTVEGQWFEWGDTKKVMDNSSDIYAEILEGTNTSILTKNTEYYFTGILKYGKPSGHEENILYIEISDIELV